MKNHNSVIKKEKNKHDKIVLLAKSKLNTRELLICKCSIDSNIKHDKFVLTNNVLRNTKKWKKKSKIQRLNQDCWRF